MIHPKEGEIWKDGSGREYQWENAMDKDGLHHCGDCICYHPQGLYKFHKTCSMDEPEETRIECGTLRCVPVTASK
jgi:hypothetical protein